MTRSPRAPELFASALLAIVLLLAGGAEASTPPPGHGILGDSVLTRGVLPAARRAWMARQSALCLVAIAEAAGRHGLPPSLMGAVARVETGRPLPVTGDRQPWPWTVNADGESLFFDTRAQAVAETQRRLAGGAKFVDIGCMQVDLRLHAHAFASLAEAFNPSANADFAARLLLSLRGRGTGWARAAGLYHSATPALRDPYQASVARMKATHAPTLGLN